MKVTNVSTPDELKLLVPHWQRLTQGRPFLSPQWLEVWWRHFGPRHACQLAVLVVEDDHGQPVAIAPWYLEPSLLNGPTLRFLGSGDVCSEYLTIACQDGWQTRAAEAIGDWLCPTIDGARAAKSAGWELLCLESTDANDPMVAQLCAALARRGAITHTREAANCWRLELPDSWDEYLALLSKSHRKRVRRLERDYFQTGRARQVIAETRAQLEEGFRILVDLHEQRWASRGESGVFDDPVIHDFHHEATTELLASRQLRLTWVELDSQPIAAEYSLVGDGVLYAYQSGMAPHADEHEPGSLALIATLKTAIDEGIRAIDFLRGNEPYKAHWRAEPRPMASIRVLPNHWQGQVRQKLWEAMVCTKRWLRTGRDAVRTVAPSRLAALPGNGLVLSSKH
jgi:CelD/BcsL family acetyltransferase involved in cellulose biosynthesis